MKALNPIVGEISPNIYAAAKRANLSPEEQNHVEQMSWALKKNRELNRLTTEEARSAYDRLDPNAQEGLKFFFGDAEYMQAPPDFSDRALGVLKFGAKAVASPLIALFKVAGAYNRVINTPYLVGRQVAQGKDIFSAKVWSDAWDGKDVYDNGALKDVTDKFGKANVYVAQGLLSGKKPGEILESYGTLNKEITTAVENAFNKPDEFRNILEATKFAQVSPGRDLVRFLAPKPPKNGGPAGDYISDAESRISGAVDFMYQLVIDPLTWVTGGASKAATKGTQLAEMYYKASANGDVAYGVSKVFQDKGVQKLWQEQLGPRIQKLSETEAGSLERANLRREIGQQFPGYNNDEALDFLVRNKVFDAESAQKTFSGAENVHYLLSGRLDGITFRRNGVVTARRERRLETGLRNKLDEVFNGVKTNAPERAATGDKVWDTLITSGERSDKAVNPNISDLLEIDSDVKGFKKQLMRVGKAAARNPAGQQILVGEDAIKTIDTVRNYARLVLPRDMADFVAQRFLKSSEDEQVVVVRNLYGAIMHRSGLSGTSDGEKVMEEMLKGTFNNRSGFSNTVDTVVDPAFAAKMPLGSVYNKDGITYTTGASAIQPSQLAGAIGPLPLEDIAREAYNIKSKKSLIYAVGGATKSKFAKDFVDFWSIFTLFPRLGIRSAIDEGFMYALTAPAKDLLSFARREGTKLGKASARYTGSSAAEDPVATALKKLFGKEVDSEALGIDFRNNLIEKIASQADNGRGVPVQEVRQIDFNRALADAAAVSLKGFSKEEVDYWTQAMVHNPDVLYSMANSISARTSLAGRFDNEILAEQINVSELTNALNKAGKDAEAAILRKTGKYTEEQIAKKIKKAGFKTGKYQEIDIRDLDAANPIYATVAHYDNWYIRFATPRQHGKLKLADGYRISPAKAFFEHNALRTPEDLERAAYGTLKRLGMKKSGNNIGLKSIPGGNAGKGTPLGDAKDVAMRKDANAAIVELDDIARQKEITSANPDAIGKSSTETSLLKLGPAIGDLSGQTIMLARNGKLANQPLRPETIAQIKSAKEAGARFIVGDMPGVDSAYYKILDEIKADYTVYHTGNAPRVKINTQTADGGWEITDAGQRAVSKFLSYYGDTVFQRAAGKSDAEIAEIYVHRILMDMRDTFHGGPGNFNDKLYEAIKDNYHTLLVKEEETGRKISDKWMKAAAGIDLNKFDDATKGFKPTGIINTRVEFPNFADTESAFKRYGNTMMEAMDKQVNALVRQKAVMVTYTKLRKAYSGTEKAYYNQTVNKMVADHIEQFNMRPLPHELTKIQQRAKDVSEKYFTELVMNEATDTVLKFVDNPSIRSNFAISARTVGRFYRATEDFQRRIYRLKDVSPTVLYRMRLSHIGLSASGMFHEDAKGDPYIMMPMDNVLFKATDTAFRILTPGTDNGYKQPMFNDFTFKLTMANPSFSPDAGLPTLSGPIAALGVLNIKNLLSTVPIPGAKVAAQEIDNIALGNIGDNMDIVRALVPSTLTRIWATLPVNEKTRQEVTAAQQAVAYNAAHGIWLKPGATDREKYEYLKNIRISAHNIVALRSVLGLISPVTPTTQESKDVPNYLLENGITGLRAEFWDIFDAINKKYGDDVQDPYEMAMSIFTGKNPGKLVYTVSRDEKQTKVLISKTNNMRNWSLNNKDFIGTYGEAGYIFGPHTGDFNAGVYNWMQAAGLLKDKSLETYYDDVMVAEDKQKYYDIASWETDSLASETLISNRKLIIQQATDARQGLLNHNPLLLSAITGGGNEIATEERMLSSLRQIVSTPDTTVDPATRIKMKTAVTAMEDFMRFVNDPNVANLANRSALKRKYRQKVEQILSELSTGDPAVREASRAVFNSILKYYSRDTYKAVG